MLQSVKRAHTIDPNHPTLHEHLVKLAVKGSCDFHFLLLSRNFSAEYLVLVAKSSIQSLREI